MEEFIDLPIIPLDATQDRYTYHFFKLLHDQTFIKQLTFKILIENLKQMVLPEVLSIHLSIRYLLYPYSLFLSSSSSLLQDKFVALLQWYYMYNTGTSKQDKYLKAELKKGKKVSRSISLIHIDIESM